METKIDPRKARKHIPELIDAAENAAEWLCECHQGTLQYDLGQQLRKVLEKIKGRAE